MNTIQEQWNFFAEAIGAENLLPEEQYNLRNAFYAGAVSMLSLQDRMYEEIVSDEAYAVAIYNVREEAVAFAEEMTSRMTTQRPKLDS